MSVQQEPVPYAEYAEYEVETHSIPTEALSEAISILIFPLVPYLPHFISRSDAERAMRRMIPEVQQRVLFMTARQKHR